jgi:hypothetical protein
MGEAMKNKLIVRSALMTVVLASLLASRIALAGDEVEPNDPYTSAQPLTVDSNGTVTVTNASIYNTTTHRDVDFYSFHASAGDVITTYIYGGMDANFNGILTDLAIWGPLPVASNALPLIVQLGSDTGQPPPGSVSTADASITGFHIPTDGTYIVGVSTDPGEFVDINTLQSGDLISWSPQAYVTAIGSYSLVITGVTPYTAPAPTPTPTPTPPPPPAPVATVLSVNIVIMPGRHNVIWLQSANASQTTSGNDADRRHGLARELRRHLKGGIPVALLSTDTFNALDVDQSSLRFGSTGTEDSLIKCNPHGVDVNHDGRPDLLCHFDVSKANFQPGDQSGTMTGTIGSDDFKGAAYLKVVTGHRDWKKERDGDHDGNRHHR